MASEFRPSEPSDAPAIAALAQRLLGVAADSPMFSDSHMRWKYWSAQDGTMPRGHVLVRDRAIVAHAGALPLRYRRGQRTFTLLHPFDWMSEPTAIGSGAALLSRLSKLADGLLIVGGSEATRRMVRPLGFRALGEVQLYAASASSASKAASSISIRAVTPETLQSADTSARGPWIGVDRQPTWLRACLSCPATRMLLLAVSRDGHPLGEFLLAHAPAQARIVGFWPASPEPGDRAALVRAAHAYASAEGGHAEIVAMANAPHEAHPLEAAGFHSTGSVPMFVLARPGTLLDDDQLAFQMLDSDFGFLHDGAPRPWLGAPASGAQ